MRVIALLSLLFGFLAQGLLDGQTFTHAALGIVFGVVAIACGLAAAREAHPHRWEGRIMAAFGLALGVWCIIMLPSAYRFQKQFNGVWEQRKQKEEQSRPANKPAAGNAGFAPGLAIGHHWPGVLIASARLCPTDL
jgi:hypothetical protein